MNFLKTYEALVLKLKQIETKNPKYILKKKLKGDI